MNARNHLQRKSPEIVILSATDRNELQFRHVVSAGNVCNRFSSDDRRPDFFRNIRGIKCVVWMPVRDEDVVAAMNLPVDPLRIRRETFLRARASVEVQLARVWPRGYFETG